MSPWHLLWIIPVSFDAGFSLMACLKIGAQEDEWLEKKHKNE